FNTVPSIAHWSLTGSVTICVNVQVPVNGSAFGLLRTNIRCAFESLAGCFAKYIYHTLSIYIISGAHTPQQPLHTVMRSPASMPVNERCFHNSTLPPVV